MPGSDKHKAKMKDLTTKIKFRSYAVTKIGEYQVCFEECFRIARGSNATEVFVGLGTDGSEVAIKRMDYKFCEYAENAKNIMNFPKLVDNPHILNYRFYKEFHKQYVCIITDLKEENLKDFVLSEIRELDELKKKGPIIFRQILLGLYALHSGDILHRDLKPENILVDCEGNMIVANFGICRILAPRKKIHKSKIRGIDEWRALESIPNDDDYEQPPEEIMVHYKKESDIQTLGMVFYFVLTKGKHPFGVFPFDILSSIKKGHSDLTGLTEDLEEAKDLIQWMLEHEVNKRPSVEQCLKHPYVIKPEEKFDLLKSVSKEFIYNETESNNSKAVQELNQATFLSSWSTKIDKDVYNHYCNHPSSRYGENGTELLRLIRNAAEYWPPPFLKRYGTPDTYFLDLFPTLPMVLHNILRNDPDWNDRNTLKQFF